MSAYAKERLLRWWPLAVLWIFTDLYLGVLCKSHLYAPDLLYLNGLFLAAASIAVFFDYRTWRKIQQCFEKKEVLSQEEEKELLGGAASSYLCQEREKMHEQENNCTQEMEAVLDYIAKWSHEAKLPLASLKLMNERNQDRELEMQMQGCIMRLEQMMHTVLMGSKLQRPEHDVKYERISLEEAVRASIKNQSYFLIQEKFEILVNVGESRVYSDKRWLVYLLDQLLANAVKYRSRAPKLQIWTERRRKEELLLYIEDNGIGISKQDLPYIFEKGYVGKNLRKGDYHSTGMGLYFVRKIAGLLHITVTVSGGGEAGVCFCLKFQDLSTHLLC